MLWISIGVFIVVATHDDDYEWKSKMSQQRANIGAHTSIEKNNLAGIQLETVFE